MTTRSRFGQQSDLVMRQFKNCVYAIDACQETLHVYQIKEQIWQHQSLRDLGVSN